MNSGLDSLLALLLIGLFGILRMLVVGLQVVERQRIKREMAEPGEICCVGKEEDCE